MADLGLLGRVDYLSTVAGGAHIGAWLAAWVKREGKLGNVEKQLASTRAARALAARPAPLPSPGPAGIILDEPEPLHHIRRLSDTVVHRFDPFRFESWAVTAIALRDLVLKQLFLLLILLFPVLAVRFVVVLYHPSYQPLVVLLGSVAIILVIYWQLLVEVLSSADRRTAREPEGGNPSRAKAVWASSLPPVVATSFLLFVPCLIDSVLS